MDEERHSHWDPETLSPVYIGVADLEYGKATLLRDNGSEGILIYEGHLATLDIGSNVTIRTWIGTCSNGDGGIKSVFAMAKREE